MSVEAALARVAELTAAIAHARDPLARPPAGAAASAQPAGAFAQALGGALAAAPATAPGALAPTAWSPLAPAGTGAPALVAAAAGELGQAEQPPGSNDSPRIAAYRAAVAGAPGPGPWCAYFVSWAARQAGAPLGDGGQGFGSVDALWSWAQRAGRAVPAASGPPRPGDLIVWDEHVGIVEGVLPDGRVQTIEGNSSDRVSRRVHPAGDALGYVRMS